MEKVIIVGTGCAGLTAAIYAARANLNPLVLEGREPGGQLTTTTLVENFPGFPEGIDGPTLIMNMKAQAERFGARFSYATVTGFEPKEGHVSVQIDGQWTDTRSLIVASGASAKWLGLDNEKKLVGHGLTSCATCDGAFYRNVPVAVVGGGDSAVEEATFLTRFASKVYLIHRRHELRASKIMAERAFSNPKIEMVWDSAPEEVLGDESGLTGVRVRNVKTGESRDLSVMGFFVAIGHKPNTELFAGQIELDDMSYIKTKPGTTQTSLDGVFACGDVQDHHYRQAVTAAGSGCMAAIEAERYLSN